MAAGRNWRALPAESWQMCYTSQRLMQTRLEKEGVCLHIDPISANKTVSITIHTT
jgi:hypothetical protein